MGSPHDFSLKATALSSPLPAGAKRLVNLFHLKDDRSGTRGPARRSGGAGADPAAYGPHCGPTSFSVEITDKPTSPNPYGYRDRGAVSLPKFPKASGLSGRCSSTSAFPESARDAAKSTTAPKGSGVRPAATKSPASARRFVPVRKAYLDAPDSPDHLCGECLKSAFHFDSARSAVLHAGIVRDRIHQFKFGGRLEWVPPLSNCSKSPIPAGNRAP